MVSTAAIGTRTRRPPASTIDPSAPHRDDAERRIAFEARDRGFEIAGLIERQHLVLVCEDDVERAGPHQINELVAKTVDAEGIGKRDRNLALRPVRKLRRDAERLLRLGRIPEVTLEIGDRRAFHGRAVDVGGRKLLAGGEVGVRWCARCPA